MTTLDPRMARLEPLIGEWLVEARQDGAPVGRSRAVHDWIEGGAFLRMTAMAAEGPHSDEWMALAPFPTVIIVGLDDHSDGFGMLYADARGVHRVYAFDLRDGRLTMDGRPKDDFHQRFRGTVAADTITGHWEASPDGVAWHVDFEQVYRRIG